MLLYLNCKNNKCAPIKTYVLTHSEYLKKCWVTLSSSSATSGNIKLLRFLMNYDILQVGTLTFALSGSCLLCQLQRISHTEDIHRRIYVYTYILFFKDSLTVLHLPGADCRRKKDNKRAATIRASKWVKRNFALNAFFLPLRLQELKCLRLVICYFFVLFLFFHIFV